MQLVGNESCIGDKQTITHFGVKTHKNLYKKCTTVSNAKRCIKEASRHGKMKRNEVREVIENLDEESENLINLMKEHKVEIGPYHLTEIVEGHKHKHRKIAKPPFKYDQMEQYVLLSVYKPIVMHSIYPFAHGSLPGRGPLQSMKVIEDWIQHDPKNTRYCAEGDIHHCYPSVDQDILSDMNHQRIKDDEFMEELDKCIYASPKGLAPGSPTSVYLIHFMFTPMDYFISSLPGVAHYLRHMDNIYLFGSNKKKLRKAMEMVKSYVEKNYHMELNHNYQTYPLDYIGKDGEHHGRPLDAVGYIFFRDHTVLRKATMLKATRKATTLSKKDKINYYDSNQMLSRLGFFKHCKMHNVFDKRISPYINVKALKHKVSQHSKKEARKEKANGIQEGKGLCEAGTGGNWQDHCISEKECFSG